MGECLNKNKVHVLICRVSALGGKWRNCFLNSASTESINPWKKANLQIPELHSQCWTTLICTRVTSAVCASGSLSSYQIQTKKMRHVGCSHIAHLQSWTRKWNHKITHRITHDMNTFKVPYSVATLDKSQRWKCNHQRHSTDSLYKMSFR